MEIKIETYEAEFIIERYLKTKGCIFQDEFSAIENKSNLVRFIDNDQGDNEYSFKAFAIMPASFKIQDEASNG